MPIRGAVRIYRDGDALVDNQAPAISLGDYEDLTVPISVTATER